MCIGCTFHYYWAQVIRCILEDADPNKFEPFVSDVGLYGPITDGIDTVGEVKKLMDDEGIDVFDATKKLFMKHHVIADDIPEEGGSVQRYHADTCEELWNDYITNIKKGD